MRPPPPPRCCCACRRRRCPRAIARVGARFARPIARPGAGATGLAAQALLRRCDGRARGGEKARRHRGSGRHGAPGPDPSTRRDGHNGACRGAHGHHPDRTGHQGVHRKAAQGRHGKRPDGGRLGQVHRQRQAVADDRGIRQGPAGRARKLVGLHRQDG
ncbi:hypothetical protein G6F57_019131 [Rhizopus arrhizus]|nr:hypothetical protein G6F57_019131 [Rhizopus arrhizus]